MLYIIIVSVGLANDKKYKQLCFENFCWRVWAACVRTPDPIFQMTIYHTLCYIVPFVLPRKAEPSPPCCLDRSHATMTDYVTSRTGVVICIIRVSTYGSSCTFRGVRFFPCSIGGFKCPPPGLLFIAVHMFPRCTRREGREIATKPSHHK